METLVIIIIIAIVIAQVCFSRHSWQKLGAYANIFGNKSSWQPARDEGGQIIGMEGEGNEIFLSIKNSISKYLSSNVGSVIDVKLLKDSIDRHCDSEEDNLASLTPIPLYLGLLGTMVSVIIGLWQVIMDTGGALESVSAVEPLLRGVAIAMSSSAVGIICTIIVSLRFKYCKHQEESGKNCFLTWMQETLLPELPTNTTSGVMKSVVRNLKNFNETFSENTKGFQTALASVRDVFDKQESVIKEIRQLDLVKMAEANASVLKTLEECLSKLPDCSSLIEKFCNDLSQVDAFIKKTDDLITKIGELTKEVNKESKRIALLENLSEAFAEHKAFYENHKNAILNEAVDVQNSVEKAMQELEKASGKSIENFQKSIVSQTQKLEETLAQQKEYMKKVIEDMTKAFETKLQELPEVVSGLNKVPDTLNSFAKRIVETNEKLANSIETSLGRRERKTGETNNPPPPTSFWNKLFGRHSRNKSSSKS